MTGPEKVASQISAMSQSSRSMRHTPRDPPPRLGWPRFHLLCDNSCESRRHAYQALGWIPAESEQKSRARGRLLVQAAHRPDDHAAVARGSLNFDVRIIALQEGDEMHSLLRHIDREARTCAPSELVHQHIALIEIPQAHAANMRGQGTVLHEFGEHSLLQAWRLAVPEMARSKPAHCPVP